MYRLKDGDDNNNSNHNIVKSTKIKSQGTKKEGKKNHMNCYTIHYNCVVLFLPRL